MRYIKRTITWLSKQSPLASVMIIMGAILPLVIISADIATGIGNGIVSGSTKETLIRFNGLLFGIFSFVTGILINNVYKMRKELERINNEE